MTPADSPKPKPPRRGLWAFVIVRLTLLVVSTWDVLRRDSGAALRRAAMDGDLQRMEEILRRRPDLVDSQATRTNLLLHIYFVSPKWLHDVLQEWGTIEFQLGESVGATALHRATWRTNLAAIELLLAAGASPDVQPRDGSTPMWSAIWDLREDIVQRFIRAGANLNKADTYDDNPLVIAAKCGDVATNITRLLLKHGAKPNTALPDGTSPLYWAAANDAPETVRLLLDAGANPNAVPRYGSPPLHEALRHEGVETARLLLEAGAKPNVTNYAGFTPLGLAIRLNRTNAVALLQSLGATP